MELEAEASAWAGSDPAGAVEDEEGETFELRLQEFEVDDGDTTSDSVSKAATAGAGPVEVASDWHGGLYSHTH